MPPYSLIESTESFAGRCRAHFAILRLDHSVKQILVAPGIVLAMALSNTHLSWWLSLRLLLGMIAITLTASSNYVLNEILDAPYDRMHPTKRNRPAARGAVHQAAAYLQWLVLGAAGLLLAHALSTAVMFSCLALWLMGCAYNIAPPRTKDIAYLDVLSESINNPLRFLAGWYLVTTSLLPPASMLTAYWMIGAYFMSLKRFSEYHQMGPELARLYRKSFEVYTHKSLLNSVTFFGSASLLFLGVFVTRYRLELIFAFPVIALLMAVYFDLAFEPDSAVQNPEKLLREPRLMALTVGCAVLMVALLYTRTVSHPSWFSSGFFAEGLGSGQKKQ